jgi:hypothetical protein
MKACWYFGLAKNPIQWVTEALSLGVKRPGREADHSHPSNAEVKECVELYLHSPNKPSWLGAQLKHRDNLYCLWSYFSLTSRTVFRWRYLLESKRDCLLYKFVLTLFQNGSNINCYFNSFVNFSPRFAAHCSYFSCCFLYTYFPGWWDTILARPSHVVDSSLLYSLWNNGNN